MERFGALLCLVVVLAIVAVPAVAVARPEWIEKVAGEKRPVKKGRK